MMYDDRVMYWIQLILELDWKCFRWLQVVFMICCGFFEVLFDVIYDVVISGLKLFWRCGLKVCWC